MRKSSKKTIYSKLFFLLAIGSLILLAGCGGSRNTPTPVPEAATNVVVLFTSTANDKLVRFSIGITGITLTDTTGKTVTLVNATSIQNGIPIEFMGLNGAFIPVGTGSVPQGTYTSATVEAGACEFIAITLPSSSLTETIDSQGTCGQGTGNTTVNLPSPITVSGTTMALSFNLQVAQSYTLTSGTNFTITPVFTLTPVPISTKAAGINARIISVNAAGNSFAAQTVAGISLNLTSDGATQFQGVAGFSNLTAGMLLNLDSAIQGNGTLLATRIEVDNTAAVTSGSVLPDSPAFPTGNFTGMALDCWAAPASGLPCYSLFSFDTSTAYHVSGQFNNLDILPFAANFSSSSLLLGQEVLITSTGGQTAEGGLIVNDFTLQPQTLNGTVTAVSNEGGFSVYTVALASYHVIPVTQELAQGPFATITSPTTVVVYADGNTQSQQSGTIAPGSLLRFRGLIFDDSGTLRMDCAEILDGVAE